MCLLKVKQSSATVMAGVEKYLYYTIETMVTESMLAARENNQEAECIQEDIGTPEKYTKFI